MIGVDEVRRQLVVGNGLAILDVDLAKDLVVPIDDHAGRFHLLEVSEIERGGLMLSVPPAEQRPAERRRDNSEQRRCRQVKPGRLHTTRALVRA